MPLAEAFYAPLGLEWFSPSSRMGCFLYQELWGGYIRVAVYDLDGTRIENAVCRKAGLYFMSTDYKQLTATLTVGQQQWILQISWEYSWSGIPKLWPGKVRYRRTGYYRCQLLGILCCLQWLLFQYTLRAASDSYPLLSRQNCSAIHRKGYLRPGDS